MEKRLKILIFLWCLFIVLIFSVTYSFYSYQKEVNDYIDIINSQRETIEQIKIIYQTQIDGLENNSKYWKDLYYGGCTTYDLYNLNLTEKDFGVRGIYYVPDFYCVWVKNNNMMDIKYAENHEIAHVLINQDYNHFCGLS